MASKRPTVRRLRSTAGAASVCALLLTGLAGCGGTDDATPKADGSSSASASSPSASASTPVPTPKVVDGTITATDKSFSLKVPASWSSAKNGVPKPFVVAVQDQKVKTDQIVVSTFGNEADAAATAKQTASGLAQQKIPCDPATIEGRVLIDCHYAYQGQQVRKMLFPFVHDGKSALVLYQTLAKTRAAGYAKLSVFLDSWRWQDGAQLAKKTG